MKNNIVKIAIVVGVLLLVPVFGTLFVEGWDWGLLDFLAMGALLFTTGLAIDFAVRRFTHPVQKVVAVGLIVLTLLLIWVELAVDGVTQILS